MQVLSKSRTFQRIAITLEDIHMFANPLLNEDRKERSKKAENEGHEPENVYTDVRCRWIECRERRWWSRWDGNLWGEGR